MLETYVLHELRAWVQLSGVGGQLAYWRTPSGSEVDFVWTRGSTRVAIEVKAAKRWRREDAATRSALRESKAVSRAFGVYTGHETLKQGGVLVLPIREFLARLAAGKVIG